MATSRGIQLAQDIRQKVAALKQVCQGVDENLLREILAALSSNR
jgi:hypothetical protein